MLTTQDYGMSWPGLVICVRQPCARNGLLRKPTDGYETICFDLTREHNGTPSHIIYQLSLLATIILLGRVAEVLYLHILALSPGTKETNANNKVQ